MINKKITLIVSYAIALTMSGTLLTLSSVPHNGWRQENTSPDAAVTRNATSSAVKPTAFPTATIQSPGTPSPQVEVYSPIKFNAYVNDCPNGESLSLGLQGVLAVGKNNLYLYGGLGENYGGSLLLKSTDKGESWMQLFDTIPHNSILFLSFIDEKQGWLVSAWVVEAIYDIKLYKTANGGEKWEYVSNIPMEYWYGHPTRMQFYSAMDGEFDFVYSIGAPVTDKISYLRTKDGGLTWFEERQRPVEVGTDGGDSTLNSYYQNLPNQNVTKDADYNTWFLSDVFSTNGYVLQENKFEVGIWEKIAQLSWRYNCSGNGLFAD